MKRRLVKKELRALEVKSARVVLRYIKLGKRTHKDVVFKLENSLEFLVYEMLYRFLPLDPTWPHTERWLDGLVDISWNRGRRSVQGQGILWYGLLKDIGGCQYDVPLEIRFRFPSRDKFHYSITVGAHPEVHFFLRYPRIPKNIAPEPL
jgi:hypothetical protein